MSQHIMISLMIFINIFLDPLKQYSCAYFKNEKETLEEAQKIKLIIL